jgi:hypothetical protein
MGEKGERGAAGITDTQIVTKTSGTNPAADKTARAFCPAGTVITGGGYTTSALSTRVGLALGAASSRSVREGRRRSSSGPRLSSRLPSLTSSGPPRVALSLEVTFLALGLGVGLFDELLAA